MRTKLIAAAAVAAVMALGGAGQAKANLVTNGGFENVTVDHSVEFGASYNYPNAIVGWSSPSTNAFNLLFVDPATATTVDADTRYTASEHQRLAPSFGGASPDGGKFVALDGDTSFNGPLQQTITGLTAGKSYAVSFYWAATQLSNRTGQTTEQLFVSLGSQTKNTGVVTNPSQGFQGWFKEKLVFTATSTSELLSFLSIGTPGGLPPMALLDGVDMEQVPEPATLALLGTGLAGFGLVARRRRRQSAVAGAA